MSFQSDLHQKLKSIFDIAVYPVVIPEQENNDAVLYTMQGGGRSSESNLKGSNVRLRDVRIYIVCKSYLKTVDYGDALYSALEGFGGLIGSNTTVFYCRVDNDIDLYNKKQNTYEKTIDLSFKIQE